jgi:hypothetical protein
MYQIATKLPDDHKTNQMAVIYIFQIAIHRIYIHFSNPRLSKIYPNRDFWFQNIPSGNPGLKDEPIA